MTAVNARQASGNDFIDGLFYVERIVEQDRELNALISIGIDASDTTLWYSIHLGPWRCRTQPCRVPKVSQQGT